MPLCGRCGRKHQTVQEVKDCYTNRRKQVRSTQSSQPVPRPSKTGQVWEPPVDPEGAKQATPSFDKENREQYN